MEPVIGMEEPWHYRNKAQYPFGYGKDGEIVTGFYAGRTHTIIANTDCLLGAPENREILEIMLDHMKRYQVPAYREETREGLVRHVLIRKGFSSGELMVCIVVNKERGSAGRRLICDGQKPVRAENSGKAVCRNNKDSWEEETGEVPEGRTWIPEQNILVDRLAMVKGMTSISVNFNHEKTNVIMGAETETIWGRDKIRDTMHLLYVDGGEFVRTDRSVTYEISPRSFYQVNSRQAEKLYSVALAYAGLTGKETVWDLYCGIGTISLFLAQAAGRVYGVEVIPDAVADACENARKNGITNAVFFVGEAEKVLPEFYEREREKIALLDMALRFNPDVIVVDPPRKGCDARCLETILKMRPERIVYVSCDSATLARDLRVLCDGGYELKKGRVCDQFCQGVHTEAVCLLSSRKTKIKLLQSRSGE